MLSLARVYVELWSRFRRSIGAVHSLFAAVAQCEGVPLGSGLVSLRSRCVLHSNSRETTSDEQTETAGTLNVLLGIIFGARIRAKRSITEAGKSYAKSVTHYDDVEKGIKIGRKGFELGKKGFEMGKKVGGKKVNISRPGPPGAGVTHPPPTYDGQSIRTFDGPFERTYPQPQTPSVRTFEGPREVRFGGERDGPTI